MASTDRIAGNEPKHPMSEVELDNKISESTAGETGDDIRSEKYQKKTPPEKKEADHGPNFDKYADQEDGDTSANAGVFN